MPNLKSLRYGRENADKAFSNYISELDLSHFHVTKSGFWINTDYPELGCSADGLIYDRDNNLKGVLEIKCPMVLAGTDPKDIDNIKPMQRNRLCYSNINGVTSLKKGHKYYYQVQMQIATCKVDYCDFVILVTKRNYCWNNFTKYWILAKLACSVS